MFERLKNIFKKKEENIFKITVTVNGKDIEYDPESLSILLKEMSEKIKTDSNISV